VCRFLSVLSVLYAKNILGNNARRDAELAECVGFLAYLAFFAKKNILGNDARRDAELAEVFVSLRT
jgi:hypothetical protein